MTEKERAVLRHTSRLALACAGIIAERLLVDRTSFPVREFIDVFNDAKNAVKEAYL